MTVQQQTPYSLANGNGVTTVFPYQFLVLNEDDLGVYVDGVRLTVNLDYTVSGVGVATGGDITLLAAPGSVTVSIIREMAIERLTDYQQAGDFLAPTVNDDFDRPMLLLQDMGAQLNRTIRTPADEIGTLPTLPSIADRNGKFLSFGADGQPIALTGTGNDADLRTDLASSAAGTDGSRLVGFRRTETGSVARSVYSKLLERVSTEDFGATVGGSLAANRTALEAAIAAADVIDVTPGSYGHLTISANNKKLVMRPGVTIKIPDGTVPALSTSGPPVLGISGSGITIEGAAFDIDGNKANNDSASFPTSVLTGALHVSGANCNINCDIKITNAYWRGFTIENGNSAGNEVDGFRARRIIVITPASYAVMLWGCKNGSIHGIEVDRGSVVGWTARVRFGSQSASTVNCKDFDVDYIRTNGAVVTEANTNRVNIGRVLCAGGKLQESTDCHVDSWIGNGALLLTDEAGNSFGMLQCHRCFVDTVIVSGHNSSAPAVSFSAASSQNIDCGVKYLSVRATQTNVADVNVRSNDGLHLGRVICKAPAGSGAGFHFDFDAGFAPQNNIRVDSIYSTGHAAGTDVIAESDAGESLLIGDINIDASVTIGTVGRKGTFTWTTGTASQVVNNPYVLARSHITITPKNDAAGVVMNGKGFDISQSAGSFTISTSDGTNTGGNSDWSYSIDNGV